MPHKGSWNEWLSSFVVGERRYVETSASGYAAAMRTVIPPEARRPKSMQGMKFTESLWTAVGTPVGNIRYLICVERIL